MEIKILQVKDYKSKTMTKSIKTLIKKAYADFNARNIDGALATIHEDVDWPNGMEGGIEHGHDAVHSYWSRQWKVIDPHVEPVQFDTDETGRIVVHVHQIIKDMTGKVLHDGMVRIIGMKQVTQEKMPL